MKMTKRQQLTEFAKRHKLRFTSGKGWASMSAPEGEWSETFDSVDELHAFVRGLIDKHQGVSPFPWMKNPVRPLRSAAAKKVAARKTVTLKNPKKGARKKNPEYSEATMRAAKLYQKFTGHDPEVIGRVTIPALPKSAACIGECDGILYTTVRDGVTERYIHKFRKPDKPMFCVSPDGKQLLLVGGNYDFTERGIVDHSDPSA